MRNDNCTSKQMGDASVQLIAGELTLAGNPSVIMPPGWPGYDIMSQRPTALESVQVKSRNRKPDPKDDGYVKYECTDRFDWLAIVLLPPQNKEQTRQVFIIPRAVADANARRSGLHTKVSNERYWRIDEVEKLFAKYQGNFALHL
jgi:hypothetical protein